MEISGKVLREVEFRDRLRGYDTDEVDEFLERVAVAVDELLVEHNAVRQRAERAERQLQEAPALDDDGIRRTLVLAQRTADLAIREARTEAEQLLGEARARAEALLADAEEEAARIREESERDVRQRAAQLGEQHERLTREIRILGALLESERARIGQSLTEALRFVNESMAVSDDVAAAMVGRREGEGPGHEPAGAGDAGQEGADDTGLATHLAGTDGDEAVPAAAPTPPRPAAADPGQPPPPPGAGAVSARPAPPPPAPSGSAESGSHAEARERSVPGSVTAESGANAMRALAGETVSADAGLPDVGDVPADVAARAGGAGRAAAPAGPARSGRNGSSRLARERDIEAELLEDAGLSAASPSLWEDPRGGARRDSGRRGSRAESGGEEDLSFNRWTRGGAGLEPLAEPPPTQAYRLDPDGGWTA